MSLALAGRAFLITESLRKTRATVRQKPPPEIRRFCPNESSHARVVSTTEEEEHHSDGGASWRWRNTMAEQEHPSAGSTRQVEEHPGMVSTTEEEAHPGSVSTVEGLEGPAW